MKHPQYGGITLLRPDLTGRPRQWQSDTLRHLSLTELHLATSHLGMRVEIMEGQPTGMIIGDCQGDLPLFPWPPTSVGRQLLQLSGLSVEEYLGGLVRCNLVAEAQWNLELAVRHAEFITKTLAISAIRRVVLVGDDAQSAFNLLGRPLWSVGLLCKNVLVICVPHPSSTQYKDPVAREKTAQWFKWAVYG